METAIWEKERELKDSLRVVYSKELSAEGDPKIQKSQVSHLMLAMLVGTPMDLGYGPLGHGIATRQELRQELAALKAQVSRPAEMVAEEKWLGDVERNFAGHIWTILDKWSQVVADVSGQVVIASGLHLNLLVGQHSPAWV